MVQDRGWSSPVLCRKKREGQKDVSLADKAPFKTSLEAPPKDFSLDLRPLPAGVTEEGNLFSGDVAPRMNQDCFVKEEGQMAYSVGSKLFIPQAHTVTRLGFPGSVQLAVCLHPRHQEGRHCSREASPTLITSA